MQETCLKKKEMDTMHNTIELFGIMLWWNNRSGMLNIYFVVFHRLRDFIEDLSNTLITQ